MANDSVFHSIQAFHKDLISIRHDIHAHPELGFQETRTSSLVADKLTEWGYEVTRGVGKTGVVGTLTGAQNSSGRSVGLRADMDALPIQEIGQHSYTSTNQGVMHACGHDGHTTTLLGAARYLAATRRFNGTLHLIFQPAEEGVGGAEAMLADGLFERFPCDAIFALHNSPDLTAGHIGIRPGPAMAAADLFDIRVKGRGGHGAHPDQLKDPIVAASHLVLALQSIVSRNVPALKSAVVTIAALQAGTLKAKNVVPNEVALCGTVRTFSEEVQTQVIQRIHAIAAGIGATFGVDVAVDYQKCVPATVNGEEHAALIADVARELFGAERLHWNYTASMGSEDFSFMLKQRPGAYFRLGNGGLDEGRGLHNASFDFNDDIIPYGSAMFVGIVERFLQLSK